jgi:tetratricopeptide (TPR) repeat protein
MEVVLACLSRAAFESGWAGSELASILGHLGTEPRARLLCVRFEKVIPPEPLPDFEYADLFEERHWNEGIARIERWLQQRQVRTGQMPPSNLPPAPKVFVDREEESQRLRHAFGPGGEGRATLVGRAGVGKSMLALQFARSEARHFPGGVWSFEAWGQPPQEALPRLAAELQSNGPPRIRLALEDLPPSATGPAVLTTLRGLSEPVLLIVEEAHHPAWRELRPGGSLRMLLISQSEDSATGAVIPLEPLSSRATRTFADALTRPPSDEKENAAREAVLRHLRGEPLGILLASHLHEQRAMGWTELDRTLQARSILDVALEHCSPQAQQLLRAAAVFANSPLPFSWLRVTAGFEHGSSQTASALEELVSLGLLTVEADGRRVTAQPLMLQWVRERLESSEREALVTRATRVAVAFLQKHVFRRINAKVLAGFNDIHPHLEILLQADPPRTKPVPWIDLACHTSHFLFLQARYREARTLLEKALRVAKALPLQESHRKVTVLLYLARAVDELGDFALATHHLHHAMEIAQASPTSLEPTTLANVLLRLADALRKQDPPAAMQLARRALALTEEALGTESPELLSKLEGLALCTREVEGPAAARPLLERALALAEKTYAPDDLAIATLASNLAGVLLELGDLDRARALLERALSIEEPVLGPRHPRLALRLANLAGVLISSARYQEALPLLERARALQEALYGPQHPALVVTLYNLGTLMRQLGSLQESRAHFARALEIAEKTHAPDHPHLAMCRSMLGSLEKELGDEEAASRHLEHALDTGLTMYTPVKGPGQEQLERALRLARGRSVNSAAFASALTEAMESAEREGSAANSARAALLLGAFEGRQGAWETAQAHLERALRLSRQSEEPLLIAESYRLLGDAHLHASRYEDARLHYTEAIRRYDEFGLELKAARTRTLLLTMLLQLGRAAELDPIEAPLRKALRQGIFVDTGERFEVEEALRLAQLLRGPLPPPD